MVALLHSDISRQRLFKSTEDNSGLNYFKSYDQNMADLWPLVAITTCSSSGSFDKWHYYR